MLGKINPYLPVSWSWGPHEGRYDVGASFSVTLILPASGNTFRFEAKAKVVRLDKRLKQLAAIFTGLDAKTINRLMQIAASKGYDSKGRAM